MSSPISKSKRRRILERDGVACARCGVETTPITGIFTRPTTADTTIDHIIARADGGLHHDSNLRVVCRSCNSRKEGERRRANRR